MIPYRFFNFWYEILSTDWDGSVPGTNLRLLSSVELRGRNQPAHQGNGCWRHLWKARPVQHHPQFHHAAAVCHSKGVGKANQCICRYHQHCLEHPQLPPDRRLFGWHLPPKKSGYFFVDIPVAIDGSNDVFTKNAHFRKQSLVF